MSFQAFLSLLGLEITDPEEESFLLFSQSLPSKDLGFLDPKASILDITVGSRELTIHQSPTILSSTREGGTTGAVVWTLTPLLANYLTTPNNIFFRTGIMKTTSTILELGCGISGIIALSLALLIKSYILTDQEYVMKLLHQNLAENPLPFAASSKSRHKVGGAKQKKQVQDEESKIMAKVLDWETDVMSSAFSSEGFDAVIASDCIYNPSLINPFVQTCVDACSLRHSARIGDETGGHPTVCIVAQQLRSSEVFEEWLREFLARFRVWRLPDTETGKELREGSGFVVHVGVLREEFSEGHEGQCGEAGEGLRC